MQSLLAYRPPENQHALRGGRAGWALCGDCGATQTRPYRVAWQRGQRCIIPADSFDEPNWSSGKNAWWRFWRVNGEPWWLNGRVELADALIRLPAVDLFRHGAAQPEKQAALF